jgi:hypothetical protein
MRSIAEWVEHLTANVEVATVLASISASSDTVKSEGWQMKQCLLKNLTKIPTPPKKLLMTFSGAWSQDDPVVAPLFVYTEKRSRVSL